MSTDIIDLVGNFVARPSALPNDDKYRLSLVNMGLSFEQKESVTQTVSDDRFNRMQDMVAHRKSTSIHGAILLGTYTYQSMDISDVVDLYQSYIDDHPIDDIANIVIPVLVESFITSRQAYAITHVLSYRIGCIIGAINKVMNSPDATPYIFGLLVSYSKLVAYTQPLIDDESINQYMIKELYFWAEDHDRVYEIMSPFNVELYGRFIRDRSHELAALSNNFMTFCLHHEQKEVTAKYINFLYDEHSDQNVLLSATIHGVDFVCGLIELNDKPLLMDMLVYFLNESHPNYLDNKESVLSSVVRTGDETVPKIMTIMGMN